jgi:hypothetical protein
MALNHVIGDKVTRAYDRETQMDARRVLTEAWATHVTTPQAMAVAA